MKVIYQTGCSRVVFHQLNVAMSLINSCYYFISSRNKSYISSHCCHYNCSIHSVLTESMSLFVWILCCSQTCSCTPVGGGPEGGMCGLRAAFSSTEAVRGLQRTCNSHYNLSKFTMKKWFLILNLHVLFQLKHY